MKLEIIKIRSIATDTATGQKGMVTHLHVTTEWALQYRIQPEGLNPETLGPVDGVWAGERRVEGRIYEHVDLPLEILGTQVKDIASGFKGTAIGLTLHTTGCVHIEVQPAGKLPKTGGPIAPADFDVRRLEGKAIPKLDDNQLKEDIAARPSPSHCPPLPNRR